jgi:hypothetical protein
MFCLSAVFNGIAFFLWRRIEAEDRLRLWQLYGWFTCLSCVGSFFGVFSMAANMQCDISLYNNQLAAQRYWTAAHVRADICDTLNNLCLTSLSCNRHSSYPKGCVLRRIRAIYGGGKADGVGSHVRFCSV